MPDERPVVERPPAFPYKPVEFHFRKLFKATVKATVHTATGQWEKLPPDAVEVIEGITLEDNKPGQLAWMLITSSMLRAMLEIYGELHYRLAEDHDLEKLGAAIEERLMDEVEIRLDRSFFNHPEQLPILDGLTGPFGDWLIGNGLEVAPARSAADRLPHYFVFGLHAEWRDRRGFYKPLFDEILGDDNPFADPARERRLWAEYQDWLGSQVELPVFDETFSLRQIYVPLRASSDTKEETEPEGLRTRVGEDRPVIVVRSVKWLDEWVKEWIQTADHNDSVRLISGGPGSGKSSYARLLAADLSAHSRDLRVVFVPLHRFDLDDDLETALQSFAAKHDYLPKLPNLAEGPRRWLLIFDGLDELGAIGEKAEEITSRFTTEVKATVDRLNQEKCRVQVLITGRDVSIDSNKSHLRRNTPVLHLLGFRPVPSGPLPPKGSEEVLELDQRKEWWANFGELTGVDFSSGLPQELDTSGLQDVTNQPLLNHLLAITYRKGNLDWSEHPTLNQIYRQLLSDVFRARHRTKRRNALRDVLSEAEFVQTLEEIALATWHGRGRSATLSDITERCNSSGLGDNLKKLAERAETGATRLLTAFYFREQQGGGDRAFEFTHKSFGEFLIARRLVRLVENVSNSLDAAASPGLTLDESALLEHWIKICGPSRIDSDLLSFLAAEIALYKPKTCRQWQMNLARLVEWMLVNGMPMHKLELGTFREQSDQGRNAEAALLYCISSCANISRNPARIQWTSGESLAKWLMSLEAFDYRLNLIRNTISGLDCSNQDLAGLLFREANLSGANLHGARLIEANLRGARLNEADLRGADLREADLRGARLNEADLRGADLREVNLSGADLREANLREARLIEANLRRAVLIEADLSGANLREAVLIEADLSGANLREADLIGADLRGTWLTQAQLAEAKGRGNTRLPKGLTPPPNWDT